MNDIRERNQKIFQMVLEGVSQQKIADIFGLSPSRIWLVKRAIKRENALAERLRGIEKELHQADDLDRLWEVTDLVDVLRAIIPARNALLKHFAGLKKERISLGEMMDLAIPEGLDSTGCQSPLYRILFIGKKGYWSIINGLSKITWNERCGREWKRKLAWLERFLRDRGELRYAPDGPWLRLR